MHANRFFTISSRFFTCAAVFALALSFAGCNRKAAPPDDNALNSALHNRISNDAALKAEPIETTVQNGVATLNGTVSSEAARALAASDAAQISGLKTVVNNLTVQAPAPAPAPVAAATPPSEPVRTVSRKVTAPKQHVEPARHTPAPIERVEPPAQTSAVSAPPKPAAPAFRDITLASGTTIPIRMTQTLSSANAQVGDSFSGTVASDIVSDGVVVIPQGTGVSGRVEAVQEAAHFKGNSLLTISLDRVNRRAGSVAVTTEPYTVQGKGRGKNTAEKVGGGAALGAILGGIFGGGKGAAIGAAAGGGAGAGANAITRGEQVQIPSESMVRFRLSSPVSLRVSTSGARDTSVSPTLQQRNSDQYSDQQPQ